MSHPAMLAKLHIARKELGLPEGEYRALLARITGSDSAKGLSDAQLDKVLVEMKRLGWKPKPSRRPPSHRADVRKIYALWGALAKAGKIASSDAAGLRNWANRQFSVSAPEFLTAEQTRAAIEQLKAWQRRPASAGERA
ncbi:gp16 family protein [Camelimonas fluminis]|uniref:Gp16 family protein n=1 Tax=Camelimonas fluminis TaxID=1576911 RepID=A0ABV7UGS3_9HYPH|nr:regulatory protein GemA [Camelimonas fluminis]